MQASISIAKFQAELGATYGDGPDDLTPYKLLAALVHADPISLPAPALAAAISNSDSTSEAKVSDPTLIRMLKKLGDANLVESGKDKRDDTVYFRASEEITEYLKAVFANQASGPSESKAMR